MTLPGGIRTRMVIVLVGIVAGALGTAYMIVVPSLERRLVDARLEQLAKVGVPLARKLPEDTLLWQDRVESYQVESNSRVVAFGVLSKNQPALAVVADSRTKSSRDVARDRVAYSALLSGRIEKDWVTVRGADYAEVAVPVRPDAVVLFQAALEDSLSTVQIVRERLLLATAFALVLALILGLTAAGMFAHRLLRLESAAERIAGGDFEAPIVDHGNDEIGELARAFDRMRVQLAQLDNARKEFVANASHELRTPLFSIGGFLELLADEELDDETRQGFIETMQGQVQRLAKLSTDLLDLSRVDAGQLTVVREPVDLSGIVQMLAGEIGFLTTSTGHQLSVATEGDVWCLGDDARILQIGRALAINALTHTGAGTTVTLRARRRGERAELCVEDDGPGIPVSQREAVFARFYRAEGGVASGSGLGLAIAREIARVMGGEVRLDSVHEPTVFTLDLPGEPVPADVARTAKVFSRENTPAEPEHVSQG